MPCTRLVFSGHDAVYLAVLDAFARYRCVTYGETLTEAGANVIAGLCEMLGASPSATADTLGFEFDPQSQLHPWVRRVALRRLELFPMLLARAHALFAVLQPISAVNLETVDLCELKARVLPTWPTDKPVHSGRLSDARYWRQEGSWAIIGS